jgi:hypothetical protein
MPKKRKNTGEYSPLDFRAALRYCRSRWYACSVLGAVCPITNLKPVSCHAPYFADFFCRRNVFICWHHLFKQTGISGKDNSASYSLPRYPHLGIPCRNFWQIDGWCPDKKIGSCYTHLPPVMDTDRHNLGLLVSITRQSVYNKTQNLCLGTTKMCRSWAKSRG